MVLRPDGDAAQVRALVRAHLTGAVTDVSPLAGGAFSRAFAVTVAGQAYVVRLSAFAHAAAAFAKDDYAGRRFASPALPIPRVIATGQAGADHFAISERVAGRRLAKVSAAVRRALLPATLDTFAAIARVDLGATRGYGPWDADGHGRFVHWHDFLAAAMDNHTEGFYQDWHGLFGASFLERQVYQVIYRHMLRLAASCPADRALLHCDYHSDNVLTDGRRITGVIDWGNACYGDPLYDVAWLGWWFVKEGDSEAATRLRRRHGNAPHFAERIACYECHLGLDDLRFYAKTGRREQYDWTRDRLLALVAGNAGQA